MRKIHKKQLLELIDTMQDACKELKKQQGECFRGLCAELQEFVSAVFAYAEEVVGEDTKLSNLLRELYEQLYIAAQGEIGVKQISKIVHKIEIEASGLKPDRIEIVFFCYKASMSDCFESVYFAAKEDPACDAYFVPIPYFERNPDGSVGQVYLEGEGYYSERYELTDWQKYDVEARRPDAIFIMNPYDGQNCVTSVHPYFYSSRLRKLTDCLVYIEYGLPYWMYRNSETALDEIKEKGNILSSHLHCHHYIAYSKEMAEYFKILFQIHPDIQKMSFTQQVLREKFVPLGSPKFDKILDDKRENYILPGQWNAKIAGKKIILYNCSLSELLKSSAEQSEKEGIYKSEDSLYFRKMRSILEAFRGQDEAVLWWRPHPLFESTLRSMRPALLDEYMSIVQDFKEWDIGIFDDTEDLHRSIAWSDAMISDESSLLWLYTATGKPFSIPAITIARSEPIHDTGADFQMPLAARLKNMRAAKGANFFGGNTCVWWHNFLDEDIRSNLHFDNFTRRFIDYVAHPEKYPDEAEYRQLQIQMFKDFVVNADGTAGRKILDFVKEKAIR